MRTHQILAVHAKRSHKKKDAKDPTSHWQSWVFFKAKLKSKMASTRVQMSTRAEIIESVGFSSRWAVEKMTPKVSHVLAAPCVVFCFLNRMCEFDFEGMSFG